MTKKQEEARSKLKWRLSTLPTVAQVAELVQEEIITKEEARDILFSDETQIKESDKIKALEEQVEFLRQVVGDLSRGTVVNLNHYAPIRYNWSTTKYPTIPTLCNANGTSTTTFTTGTIKYLN